ncbi:hypothetical protein ACFOX3_12485 [Simiduia curdlanivorans]|uniref:Uncharacterized protein n=2 Tax=Simiduia curdlanivorans TaxID=1492769 RepID=A0ABV8V5E7_9GAMM
MAGNSQPKTKAEILRELQSIQLLLDENAGNAADPDEDFPALDDDDIPLLDAFLDDDDTSEDESDQDRDQQSAANAETLDALNAAYAALTGELEQLTGDSEPKQHEKTPEKKPTQQPVAQTAPRPNAPPHPQQTKQAHQLPPAHAKPRPHEPENRDQFREAEAFGFELDHQLSAEHNSALHTDPSAPAPLPGQQSLFEPAKPDSNNRADSSKKADSDDKDANRPAPVTKASGENPFLPQHIRERLRGNQPLPKGEFLLPMTPPAYMDMDNLSQHFSSDGLTPKQQETLAGMQQEAQAKQQEAKQQAQAKQQTTDKHPATATKPQAIEKASTPEQAVDKNVNAEKTNSKSPTKLPKPDIATVINDVIEEFLPLIEARLRKRLSETLSDEEPTEH